MQTRAFLFEEAAEGPGVFQGAPPFWDQAVNGIAQQVGEFGHYGQPVSMACRPGMIPGRFWVRERRGDRLPYGNGATAKEDVRFAHGGLRWGFSWG